MFENRDEALANFLSSFCVKNGRKHPPVMIVGGLQGQNPNGTNHTGE